MPVSRSIAAAAWAVDRGGGFPGRTGRVLAEVVLKLLSMVGHLASGHGEVEPLESLDAPLPELAEVAPQGVLGDPR